MKLWTRLHVPRLRLANHALVAQISQEMSLRGIRFYPLQALADELANNGFCLTLKSIPSPNFDFSIEDLDPENQPASDLVDWFLESMPTLKDNLLAFWQIAWDDEECGTSSIRLWFFNTAATGVSTSPQPMTGVINKLKPATAAKPPVAAAPATSVVKAALLKKRKEV
jgi:hypothetical protein